MDLGPLLPDFRVPVRPTVLPAGARVGLEPLGPGHAASLVAAFAEDPQVWTYLPYGPFDAAGAYADWAARAGATGDPVFQAICVEGRALGVASYLRITPLMGTIEIGHIALSARLQRTAAGTEALSIMIGWAIDAGYRRVEWKCNALNRASRAAAQRLGFSFEGVHRQAAIAKGRSRDTAWFSILDREWPALRAAHVAWLAPGTFDADGRQTRQLSQMTAPLLAARDPSLSTERERSGNRPTD